MKLSKRIHWLYDPEPCLMPGGGLAPRNIPRSEEEAEIVLSEIEEEVAELEAMLQQAARDAFVSDVVETHMLELELEANPWIGAEQYKEDWVESWIDALKEAASPNTQEVE